MEAWSTDFYDAAEAAHQHADRLRDEAHLRYFALRDQGFSVPLAYVASGAPLASRRMSRAEARLAHARFVYGGDSPSAA